MYTTTNITNITAVVHNNNIFTDYFVQNGKLHLSNGEIIPANDVHILYQAFQEEGVFKGETSFHFLEVVEGWKGWAPAEENPSFHPEMEGEPIWLDYFDYLSIRGATYDVAKALSFSPEPGKLYFGLELELMAPEDPQDFHSTVEDIKSIEALEEGLPVMDTSVDLEIVTIPMEAGKMKGWIERSRSLIETIGVNHPGPEEGVGAHIHLSRDAFVSQLAEAYFTIVINNALMSGRYEWLFGGVNELNAKPEKKTLGNHGSKSRYEAVNTLNSKTIEVRAFRATNDPELLKSRVDWLERAVTWANRKAQS